MSVLMIGNQRKAKEGRRRQTMLERAHSWSSSALADVQTKKMFPRQTAHTTRAEGAGFQPTNKERCKGCACICVRGGRAACILLLDPAGRGKCLSSPVGLLLHVLQQLGDVIHFYVGVARVHCASDNRGAFWWRVAAVRVCGARVYV